jgi:uncharacterized protein (DUF1778 family)
MKNQAQISVKISAATREKLERFTEQHGLTQSFVIEQALLYFIEARDRLPEQALIPARVVLDDKVFDRVMELLKHPPVPTKALCDLMRGQGH